MPPLPSLPSPSATASNAPWPAVKEILRKLLKVKRVEKAALGASERYPAYPHPRRKDHPVPKTITGQCYCHTGDLDIVHVKDSLDRTFVTWTQNLGYQLSLLKGKDTKLTAVERH
ncbi:40s ribosomal protein s4 [Moniliophthora roreri]|nr:40s ribosomal protein s4 [Moniliophthora roreri]